MIYINFDGVILDTEELLFKKWRENPNHKNLSELEKIKYIQREDWEYIIKNSPEINDSIYYLHNMDPNESAILTKIHSLGNEGYAKFKWVESNNIKQPLIFVPYMKKKCDIVIAKNNILVDDSLKNIREWKEALGEGILFDIDDDNYDSWHQYNLEGFPKVLNLSQFKRR